MPEFFYIEVCRPERIFPLSVFSISGALMVIHLIIGVDSSIKHFGPDGTKDIISNAVDGDY